MAKPIIYDRTCKICDRTELMMEDDTVIGDFNFISVPLLRMLKGAQTNRFVSISGRATVTIGRHATIGDHVSVLTSVDTPYGIMNDQMPPEMRHVKTGDIVIGDYAFIGPHTTINPGVNIGPGAVVGANSFITSDRRPWHISHPAKTTEITVFRVVDVPIPGYPVEEMKAAKERLWLKEDK
jgi:carbonic anhydrase/acetyltransferase-like protein (isoleucine patch superfamily)